MLCRYQRRLPAMLDGSARCPASRPGSMGRWQNRTFSILKSRIGSSADMQIYLVGGAVRDALLGLPVKDRDWVVVGATPDQLMAQGFVPVGKDFPVFLHPPTHEEYALASAELKTGPGYHGFSIHATPDVTLEEDLSRRDLTINSIAVNADCVSATGQ